MRVLARGGGPAGVGSGAPPAGSLLITRRDTVYLDPGAFVTDVAEFEAALSVEGAPDKAKEAATKGLGTLSTEKKPERP